ncbi:unnamed protein product [Amoebophrya sp. A120]|nr:unnamed protein product [Amoebophrya sp. A120]|eukprot:GSA120T00015838001.1
MSANSSKGKDQYVYFEFSALGGRATRHLQEQHELDSHGNNSTGESNKKKDQKQNLKMFLVLKLNHDLRDFDGDYLVTSTNPCLQGVRHASCWRDEQHRGFDATLHEMCIARNRLLSAGAEAEDDLMLLTQQALMNRRMREKMLGFGEAGQNSNGAGHAGEATDGTMIRRTASVAALNEPEDQLLDNGRYQPEMELVAQMRQTSKDEDKKQMDRHREAQNRQTRKNLDSVIFRDKFGKIVDRSKPRFNSPVPLTAPKLTPRGGGGGAHQSKQNQRAHQISTERSVSKSPRGEIHTPSGSHASGAAQDLNDAVARYKDNTRVLTGGVNEDKRFSAQKKRSGTLALPGEGPRRGPSKSPAGSPRISGSPKGGGGGESTLLTPSPRSIRSRTPSNRSERSQQSSSERSGQPRTSNTNPAAQALPSVLGASSAVQSNFLQNKQLAAEGKHRATAPEMVDEDPNGYEPKLQRKTSSVFNLFGGRDNALTKTSAQAKFFESIATSAAATTDTTSSAAAKKKRASLDDDDDRAFPEAREFGYHKYNDMYRLRPGELLQTEVPSSLLYDEKYGHISGVNFHTKVHEQIGRDNDKDHDLSYVLNHPGLRTRYILHVHVPRFPFSDEDLLKMKRNADEHFMYKRLIQKSAEDYAKTVDEAKLSVRKVWRCVMTHALLEIESQSLIANRQAVVERKNSKSPRPSPRNSPVPSNDPSPLPTPEPSPRFIVGADGQEQETGIQTVKAMSKEEKARNQPKKQDIIRVGAPAIGSGGRHFDKDVAAAHALAGLWDVYQNQKQMQKVLSIEVSFLEKDKFVFLVWRGMAETALKRVTKQHYERSVAGRARCCGMC